ncbi:MAG: SMC-Scp complex subunit ScpB [Deltaproteobacteria bacterium]|nr:SMC-Scp complex subunit ScpB [Deltaproteobacteria bacterium]
MDSDRETKHDQKHDEERLASDVDAKQLHKNVDESDPESIPNPKAVLDDPTSPQENVASHQDQDAPKKSDEQNELGEQDDQDAPKESDESDDPSEQNDSEQRDDGLSDDPLENALAAAGFEDVSSTFASILESILFVADKPLTIAALKKILDDPDTQILKRGLAALTEIRRTSGIQLVQVAGGYQLRTNQEHARWIRRMTREKPTRLSRAALEILAVVAYRQPVTRMEVEDIRGVDCGGVLRMLLERSLIRILGRKDEPGRPILYGTSRDFLTFFGLKNLKELPSLRDLDDLELEAAGLQPPPRNAAVDRSVAVADGLEELLAQAEPVQKDDPELETALEEAMSAATSARRTFRKIQEREVSLKPAPTIASEGEPPDTAQTTESSQAVAEGTEPQKPAEDLDELAKRKLADLDQTKSDSEQPEGPTES